MKIIIHSKNHSVQLIHSKLTKMKVSRMDNWSTSAAVLSAESGKHSKIKGIAVLEQSVEISDSLLGVVIKVFKPQLLYIVVAAHISEGKHTSHIWASSFHQLSSVLAKGLKTEIVHAHFPLDCM